MSRINNNNNNTNSTDSLAFLNTLRQRRDTAKELRQDIIAEFWAEQVLAFSNDILDLYAFALILFNAQHHHRVISQLYPSISKSLACRILLIRSLLALERTEEALELIEAITSSTNFPSVSSSLTPLVSTPASYPTLLPSHGNKGEEKEKGKVEELLKTPKPASTRHTINSHQFKPPVTSPFSTSHKVDFNSIETTADPISLLPHETHRLAVLWTLRGEIYMRKKQMLIAKDCFVQALLYDVTAFDAFSYLTYFHLMDPKQGQEPSWLHPSKFSSALTTVSSTLVNWVFQLYILQFSKSRFFESSFTPTSFSASPQPLTPIHSISKPSPFHIAKHKIEELKHSFRLCSEYWYFTYFTAEAAMASGAYGHAKALLEPWVFKDPYHSPLLLSYLQCLTVLSDTSKLFQMSQLLSHHLPNHVLTAYATGCYYLSQPSRHSDAQTWFLAATSIQDSFVYGWLGYAAASIQHKDYDSVMSALNLASKYMPFSYLPSLYKARTAQWHRQLGMALAFYEKAYELCPDHIEVCTEYGLICLEEGKCNDSMKYLKKAAKLLEIRPSPSPKLYMQIHFGLGKLYYRLGQDALALQHLQIAISQDPFDPVPELFVLLADIYLKQNNTTASIDLYHRALSLTAGDPLINDKLSRAIAIASNLAQPDLKGPPKDTVMETKHLKAWLSRRPIEATAQSPRQPSGKGKRKLST